VDFTNTVLIMTSNLRGEPLDVFKPEFVNRIDEIVRFRSLEREDIAKILEIQLMVLTDRLKGRRLSLEVSAAAKETLADHGYDPTFGARPLRRVIQREISDRLALALLGGRYPEGSTVHVGEKDGELTLS
jgi:ATP-dependent Clp protease ATP-binding subunit ClpB